jgi:hypothetical protein
MNLAELGDGLVDGGLDIRFLGDIGHAEEGAVTQLSGNLPAPLLGKIENRYLPSLCHEIADTGLSQA